MSDKRQETGQCTGDKRSLKKKTIEVKNNKKEDLKIEEEEDNVQRKQDSTYCRRELGMVLR